MLSPWTSFSPHTRPARSRANWMAMGWVGVLLLVVLTATEKLRAEAPSAQPLHLQWFRPLPTQTPAWPDQPRVDFGSYYTPVLVDQVAILASSRTDSIAGYNLGTGEEKWRFYCEGPVRLPPTVWKKRVYFVSDDGYLYCVDGQRGTLHWKFRGGPSDQKVLGNERLISAWPARGGPAVAVEKDGKGTVYFAAGIWPFMGIYLHALDAETGKVRWTNSGDGTRYLLQPHRAYAFAGVAPQGSLVVSGDSLLVPGGRSIPACHDRHTGKLIHYRLSENSKRGGGWKVQAAQDVYFNGGVVFDLKTGVARGWLPGPKVIAGDTLYAVVDTRCQALDLKQAGLVKKVVKDRRGRKRRLTVWAAPPISPRHEARVGPTHLLGLGGGQLFGASAGKVFACRLPLSGQAQPDWEASVKGTPTHLAASRGHLVVSTREGGIYCFGPRKGEPRRFALPQPRRKEVGESWQQLAQQLRKHTRSTSGYAVVWGVGSGELIRELASRTPLHLIVVEPDARQVHSFRGQLLREGLLGTRVAVLHAHPETVQLPPYLATLMVSESLADAGVGNEKEGQANLKAWLRIVHRSLRPFGGTACLPLSAQQTEQLKKLLASDNKYFEGAKLSTLPGKGKPTQVLLVREGALPGSANWTHEHADAANTRVSRDTRVKAPLGLLWFGGPGHQGILPRHGHGPQPQVIDGRLIIEGVDMLRALDIYTGRKLWEVELPGVGKAFNNTAHHPGANASSTNYISLSDGIHVAYGDACLVLDPDTGKVIRTFRQPALPGEKKPPRWDYLNVVEDYLIGGANPPGTDPKGRSAAIAASRRLVVLNRKTGKVLWQTTAASGFRHNAICAGGGRLYVIDRPSKEYVAWLRRRGKTPPTDSRLLALDLKTGKPVWTSKNSKGGRDLGGGKIPSKAKASPVSPPQVFGTWLSYSAKHDILVEAGRRARDTLRDEPRGMRAYDAGTGKVLWFQSKYQGPAMIRGDQILKFRSACDIRTGEPILRTDPLTGEKLPWVWTRNYGCNTPQASTHLLTFRSGAAGYFDLCGDSGTGNLGGFRSGCTNNLVVAGGLLNAPDYTRTCTCGYQNQTSLALIHMPETEMWTFYGPQLGKGTLRQVGINLGAPGDRKSDDGTLWLDAPSVGGPSPRVGVTFSPARPEVFRCHADVVKGKKGLKWVSASGVRGIQSVSVDLRANHPRPYTIRLHFQEPDSLSAGARIMNLAIQGKTVAQKLDISREAGGAGHMLVKEFRGVRVRGPLTITLTPDRSSRVKETLLCGIEILAQGW